MNKNNKLKNKTNQNLVLKKWEKNPGIYQLIQHHPI